MSDARLLVPAAGTWLGAGLAGWRIGVEPTLAGQHRTAIGLAWLVVVVAIGVPLALAVRRPHATAYRAVAVGAAGLLCGMAAAVVAVLPRTDEPLAGWVDARATSAVVAVVSGEPVVRRGRAAASWQESSWVVVRVVAEEIRARGGVVRGRLPLLVRLPAGALPPAGAEIGLTGRLAHPPSRVDAAAQLVVRSTPAFVLLSPPGQLDRVSQSMRTALRRAVADQAPDPASLVTGLAIGDDSTQPAELTSAMRASGLSHLTAVSGGNVAIVLGVVLLALSAARLPLGVRVVGALGALAFFVHLVGSEPSVLRAAVMGGVIVLGLLAGGRRGGPAPLGAAVIGLVIVEPALARSWGFALSVAATAGLLLFVPPIRLRLARWPPLSRWPSALLTALAVTLAAQLATGPLLLLMVGTMGWVAVPANLAAMPAVPLVTVLGLAAAAVGPIAPGAAAWVGAVASWPAGWIATVARVGADLPGAQVGRATVALVLGFGVLLATRCARERHLPSRRWTSSAIRLALSAALLVGVVVVLVPPSRRGWPPPGWLVLMCDVGQGDAVLVRAGPDAAVVVDTGPDPERVDSCLTDAGVAVIPAVVLTHFHADHVGGLAGVLRGRQVGSVVVSPVREPPEEARQVDELLADHGLRAEPVTAGDSRALPGLTWQVLWPRRRIMAASVPNNASLVLAIELEGRSLLLAGDIEPEAQAALAVDLARRRFDVVKVPHHGSRFQAPGFVSWARAPIALVSVGADNTYGHPAAQTLAAWQGIGALVGRTDVQGDLAVVVSGSGLGLVARGGMLPPS